VTSDKSLGRTL